MKAKKKKESSVSKLNVVGNTRGKKHRESTILIKNIVDDEKKNIQNSKAGLASFREKLYNAVKKASLSINKDNDPTI